jgi:hypothetical protein
MRRQDISFTISAGSPLPASGHFAYDASVPIFSDFHVFWMGVDFDLTAPASNPIIVEGGGCPGSAGPAASFSLLNHALGGCVLLESWHAQQVAVSNFSQADFQFNDFSASGLIAIDRFINLPPPVQPFAVAGGSWSIEPRARVTAPESLVVLLSSLASLHFSRRRQCRTRDVSAVGTKAP